MHSISRQYDHIVGLDSLYFGTDKGSHAQWLARWFDLGERWGRLSEQALRDPLTGAWNRRRFEEAFGELLERAVRDRAPHAHIPGGLAPRSSLGWMVRGVLGLLAPLGTRVRKGDCVARIVDPLDSRHPETRVEILAQTDGLLFAHTDSRFVTPGQVLCKVAGSESMASRKAGHLLSD